MHILWAKSFRHSTLEVRLAGRQMLNVWIFLNALRNNNPAVWVAVLFETERWSGMKNPQTSNEDDLPAEFVFCQLILSLTVLLKIDFKDFHGGNFEPVGNLNNLLQVPFSWCIFLQCLVTLPLRSALSFVKVRKTLPSFASLRVYWRVNVCENNRLNDCYFRNCTFKSLMLKYSNAISVKTGYLDGYMKCSNLSEPRNIGKDKI